jgi:hypothetical protein
VNIILREGGCDRSRGDALRVTFDQLDYAGRQAAGTVSLWRGASFGQHPLHQLVAVGFG